MHSWLTANRRRESDDHQHESIYTVRVNVDGVRAHMRILDTTACDGPPDGELPSVSPLTPGQRTQRPVDPELPM